MARLVTPEDLFALRGLGHPTVHPDGQRVAYEVTTARRDADDNDTQIWCIEGGAPYALTANGNNRAPAWSPDGRWLAYLSGRNGGFPHLEVMPAGGGEPRSYDLPGAATALHWAPSSDELLVEVRRAPEEPEPPVARVIATLRYRLNGQGWTYSRPRHLFRVVRSTGEAIRVAGDDRTSILAAAWSPDGEAWAYVETDHPPLNQASTHRLRVAARGLQPETVLTSEGRLDSLSWSPDGAQLAFGGEEAGSSAPRHRRLMVLDLRTQNVRRMACGYDRPLSNGTSLEWWPDGQRIGALFDDAGAVVWASVGWDDDRVTIHTPQESVASAAVLAGSTLYTVSSDPVSPPELWRQSVEPEAERAPLTRYHQDWREAVSLSAPVAFRAVSADGTEVPAWILPPAEGPAGRHPVMLKIHGGPYGQYGYGFSHEFQLLASSGYAVLYANPRGSTGYDEAYARALRDQRGLVDLADILAVVDGALAQFPWLDGERLALGGGSYGGYLTAWVVGHTTRFRAAVAEASPINLISMSGTGDQAGYNHPKMYGKSPEEDPEYFWERSPLAHVTQVTTPTLLIHGEADLRVPIGQSEEFFVALTRLHRPVRFVRFPGADHGFSRSGRPSQRLRRYQEILSWINHHVRGADAGHPATRETTGQARDPG